LNQGCALVHDLESMLLRDPPQNRFSTVSVKLGRAGDVRCMTALPPKAEVHPRSCYVAFVPKAAVSNRSKAAALFDHLVGAREQRRRHREAEHSRGLGCDYQFRRLQKERDALHTQVAKP
jgi:hypothetical protein